MTGPRLRPEHEVLLRQVETLLTELDAEESAPSPTHGPAGAGSPEQFARALLNAEARRAQAFEELEFHDPQWLMLLDLFAARREGREICVTSLCIASGVPATTALRHIAFLEARGMVRRRAHSSDARRSIVMLTEGAATRISRHLEAVQKMLAPAPIWPGAKSGN